MGQNPPIDELQSRKRLIQAKMELHRAEMFLYYNEVIAPIQNVQSKLQRFTDHPLARFAVIGGFGFMLVTGRLRMVKRLAGFIVPMLFPSMRRFLMGNAGRLAIKLFQVLR
jgi:hypothetical protein